LIWFMTPKKIQPQGVAQNQPTAGNIVLFFKIMGGAFVIFVGIIAVKLFRHYDRGVNRAFKQANAGDLEGAISELGRQIEDKGPSAARANALGCLMMQRKDWDEANRLFDEAEQLGTDRRLIQNNRAVVLLESGNPAAALPLFEQAALAQPNELIFQCNICRALAELGRFDEASGRLDRVEQLGRKTYFPNSSHRQLIDKIIQECRDRIAGETKADLTALDEL
jgi:tetratricopeptide (TPR) repeat protein